jgi:hypothetical protein
MAAVMWRRRDEYASHHHEEYASHHHEKVRL